ncbi:unnamed protein product [Prorocentrum cordatum]|uniref:Gamma-glutamylcyclotransferase AIG2-like domain-containing protein n=1 Tax=Prorocentrum cordatum TaxID=2364126 RepID=A0ABN9RFJ6_9DINO|nr:unnamed protein product [Polarella glacialis]
MLAQGAVHQDNCMSGMASAPPKFGDRRATFGFGSNSVRQLRGRLGDCTLRGYPGQVRGHVLAFVGPNKSWALNDQCEPGGTATLVPAPGDVALGTVVFLTEEQLAVLDGFEGVPSTYDRRDFEAEVLMDGEWRPMPVVAYIRQDSSQWYPPSEAYLCAVLRNLRGSFPALRTLTLRDAEGKVRGSWSHPGFGELCTGALLFEIGVRMPEPWQLPREIAERLRRLGAERGGAGGAAAALGLRPEAAGGGGGGPALEAGEAAVARALLSRAADAESSEDEAQAERAAEGPARAGPAAAS